MEKATLETHPIFKPSGILFKKPVRPSSSGRLLQVFLNTDMRNRHDGLSSLAKEHNIDTQKLQPGQFVAFVNTHKDRIALFAANGVIAYQRLEGGRRVDLRAIAEIPRVFNSTGKLDYDEALKEAITKVLVRRPSNRVSE